MTEELMNLDLLNPDAVHKPARIISIDRMRGLCIFIMVVDFLLNVFASTGAFSSGFALTLLKLCEHGTKGVLILPGVSFADIFAPAFIFVIGLTMVRSFKSRERKDGTGQAYFQLAVRFLALIGVGSLFGGFEDGWSAYFADNKPIWENAKSIQVFMVGFWIAFGLLVIVMIAGCTKSKKLKKWTSLALRYTLALFGLISLYYIIAATGEKLGNPSPVWTYMWAWDTLQNIGLAGLVALPFVKFGKYGRLMIVTIIFAVMSILYKFGALGIGTLIIEGGIFGAFGWGSILLLGTVFAELKDDKNYWVLTSVLLVVSIVMVFAGGFVAQKRGCTPVFAMFTAACSSIIWGFLNFFNHRKTKFAFFSWWGGSAIMVYVVNYLFFNLLLGFHFAKNGIVYSTTQATFAILGILAFFTVINWLLYKFDKHIRI